MNNRQGLELEAETAPCRAGMTAAEAQTVAEADTVAASCKYMGKTWNILQMHHKHKHKNFGY